MGQMKILLCFNVFLILLLGCSKDLNPKAVRPLGSEEKRYARHGYVFGKPLNLATKKNTESVNPKNTQEDS